MGQNCCTNCNTNFQDFTLESDEGTDSFQIESIKSQLKFINIYSIPFVLSSNQLKNEFLKDVNSHQQSIKKINLYNTKVQSLTNDALGIYIEQQFNYNVSQFQILNPILVVNLITDQQRMKKYTQENYQLDQNQLNVALFEFQGNKFIHTSNDRILSQYTSMQQMKEIFLCIDNCIEQTYKIDQFQQNHKNRQVINEENMKAQKKKNSKYKSDINKMVLQDQNNQYVYIPILNPCFCNLIQEGKQLNIIDIKNKQYFGYDNVEYVLKLTQILQKSVNSLLQNPIAQQTNKGTLNNDQNKNRSHQDQNIFIVIIQKSRLIQTQNFQMGQVKSNLTNINKFIITNISQLILKQLIFYEDYVNFLLVEPVYNTLDAKQFKSCTVDKLMSVQHLKIDQLYYNYRQSFFDQINKVFLQSCKEMQQSDHFEHYLINSLHYFMKRSPIQIQQKHNNQQNLQNIYYIAQKNSNLKPQDVINMNHISDNIFQLCSTAIFNDYFNNQNKIQSNQIHNINKQNQNLSLLTDKISNILNELKLKENSQNNFRFDSENFFTEGIQEQGQPHNQSPLNQRKHEQIENQKNQTFQSPKYQDQNHSLTTKNMNTPIQDNNPLSTKSFSIKQSELAINSLPISPQNFQSIKAVNNFSSPNQIKLFQSPQNMENKIYSQQQQYNSNQQSEKYQMKENNQNYPKRDNQSHIKNNIEEKQIEQSHKTKNVNFMINSSNNQNIKMDQQEDNGYDSPTFLSTKNINSSFNIIDKGDQQSAQKFSIKSNQQNFFIEEEQNIQFDKNSSFRMTNNSPSQLLEIFQKLEIYNKKQDQFLGCIFGQFLGDSMGLYIRNKKQFSVKDIQVSMNMDYSPNNSCLNPGQLSEWSEMSLEVGYALSSKQGVFFQKDIIDNLIEWFNSRPILNSTQKPLYKVLKYISSIQDEIKDEDLYRTIQSKSQTEMKDSNHPDHLTRMSFISIFTFAILDDDFIRIVKSDVNLFNSSQNQLLLNSCIIYCYCIKQLFNFNLDRKKSFIKTIQFCQVTLKDSNLFEILQQCMNSTMKIFDHVSIQNNPLAFIIYLSFYLFYNNFEFESALQTVYSYGGDTCLFGSIVGCLIGAATGFSKLPYNQIQTMVNLNPENAQTCTRPEKYSPKHSISVAKQILEFYITKE